MLYPLLLAFGLSMDSFTVAVSTGIGAKNKLTDALRLATSFAVFQAMTPLIGWFIGNMLFALISTVDHWIAFGILGLIGIKMIYSSVLKKEEKKTGRLSTSLLLGLSIGTSIDALIIGISFAFIDISIFSSILTIGLVTFLLSCFGVFIRNKIGRLLKTRAEIVGGLILIGLGVKILLEHSL
jgi:putative Mn2+ efflux pump MntP